MIFLKKMDKLMNNPNLWHLRDHIFGFLNHETVEKCRQVSQLWNESLERISIVIFLQEFGNRNVVTPDEKVSTIIPGWQKAAKKYGAQASIEDLREVKNSLQRLALGNDWCWSEPVHIAAKEGAVKLIKFVLETSYDMNARNNIGWTALHLACEYGRTEIVQLIIQSSKDFGIDLNAKDIYRSTAWHEACCYGQTETAQLIIQSSKDFGIDLNAKDDDGWTALHFACNRGQTETVQMILKNWKEFGIDIKAQDNDYLSKKIFLRLNN